MEDFDYPEPYENDLEEYGNREAWEDSRGGMNEPCGECPHCGADISPDEINEPCWDCGALPGEDPDEIDYENSTDGWHDYPSDY